LSDCLFFALIFLSSLLIDSLSDEHDASVPSPYSFHFLSTPSPFVFPRSPLDSHAPSFLLAGPRRDVLDQFFRDFSFPLFIGARALDLRRGQAPTSTAAMVSDPVLPSVFFSPGPPHCLLRIIEFSLLSSFLLLVLSFPQPQDFCAFFFSVDRSLFSCQDVCSLISWSSFFVCGGFFVPLKTLFLSPHRVGMCLRLSWVGFNLFSLHKSNSPPVGQTHP